MSNNFNNLDEMDHFLGRYSIKSPQEEIDNLNNSNCMNEIQFFVKIPPKEKTSSSDSFTLEFYQTSKWKLILILYNLLQKIEEEGTLPKSFYEAVLTHNHTMMLQEKKTKDQCPSWI